MYKKNNNIGQKSAKICKIQQKLYISIRKNQQIMARVKFKEGQPIQSWRGSYAGITYHCERDATKSGVSC
jgi:hypothetical protein